METQELKKNLDDMLDHLFLELRKRLESSLRGIALTGSYTTGKFSSSRPDINFFLFLEGPSAQTYLALGEVFTDLIRKYEGTFVIRPEFRPFKFPYPVAQKGVEVFINPLIADLAEKDLDHPFGISKPVLHGTQQMRKVIFGPDILGSLDLSFGKKEVIEAALRDLAIFKLQLIRAPSTYVLDEDISLLFNEALIVGKMTIGWGVEVCSSDKELRDGDHLKYLKDRKKTMEFYRKNVSPEAANSVKTILEARDKYGEWKNDKEKAYLVFTESYNLLNVVWGKLLEQLNP